MSVLKIGAMRGRPEGSLREEVFRKSRLTPEPQKNADRIKARGEPLERRGLHMESLVEHPSLKSGS
jgi:hypothetical protein